MADADARETIAGAGAVHFVYDSGLQKIEQQVKLRDSIDVKTGVLIGFLGAFIIGLLVTCVTGEGSRASSWLWLPTKVVLSIGVSLVVFCLYFAFRAFRSRQYYYGIRFQDLIKWVKQDVATTKEAFVSVLLDAIEANDRELTRKEINARRAEMLVLAVLLFLWASVLLLGLQFLLGRVKS